MSLKHVCMSVTRRDFERDIIYIKKTIRWYALNKASPRFITFSIPEERKRARVKYFTEDNKDSWALPPLSRPIVAVGDSQINIITHISSAYIQHTTLVSYSGMKFKHLYDVLLKLVIPNLQVKHLILAVGINNRFQNAETTANKVIHSQKLEYTFQHAQDTKIPHGT